MRPAQKLSAEICCGPISMLLVSLGWVWPTAIRLPCGGVGADRRQEQTAKQDQNKSDDYKETYDYIGCDWLQGY